MRPLLVLCLVGCAASRPAPDPLPPEPTPIDLAPVEPQRSSAPAPVPVVAPPPVPTECTSFARPNVLRREVVVRTVEAGLGRWIAGGVDVDPGIRGGRFRGWIVRSLPPGPCYQQVDLKPGDLVLRVNGRGVEKPDEANDVFSALRTASSLIVDYVRDDKPRQVKLAITD